jgi:hypothetical protein
MKKIVSLLIILLVTKIVVAQSNAELQMMSDSAKTAIQNTIFEIRTLYGNSSSNYPDSIKNVYLNALNTLEYRSQLIARHEAIKWSQRNDSFAKSNKFACKPQPKLGFGVTENQAFFSAQYAFTANWHRNYNIGIGSGIEYVNRGSGLVQVLQMPVYITNNLFLGKFTFLNFDYGLTVPLSGNYKNAKDDMIDYKPNELNNNMYFDLGLGYLNTSDVGIQFNVRNQSLGVPEPLNQRVWMFGLKLSF